MSKDQFTPKSSFITLAEYDSSSRLMTITFKTGTQYHYLNVFNATWLSFKQSPDHSSYYSRAIKGHSISVPVVKKGPGKSISNALHHQTQRRSLDAGIKHQENNLNGNARKRPRDPIKQPGNIPNSLGR